jgi:predicted NAD-dependent protein-ADP-ribosyltransferase YbiA (DUF1768 family)
MTALKMSTGPRVVLLSCLLALAGCSTAQRHVSASKFQRSFTDSQADMGGRQYFFSGETNGCIYISRITWADWWAFSKLRWQTLFTETNRLPPDFLQCVRQKKHEPHRPSMTIYTYPTNWWAPAPKEGAPAWEILPQEAGPGEVILSKRNELGLLSNFAPTPFTFHGKRYASLEGFWQMMKYPEGADDPRAKFPGLTWPHTREQVSQMTAFEANRAGRAGEDNMKKMEITWVTFEGKQMQYRAKEKGEFYQLIVEATHEKVRQNPEVKKVLLATGHLILKPDHHQEPDAPPAWRYYEILTQIRTELQRKSPSY